MAPKMARGQRIPAKLKLRGGVGCGSTKGRKDMGALMRGEGGTRGRRVGEI